MVADDAVLVQEASIVAGMRMLLDHAGLVVEPSAALGIAAILENRDRFAGRHAVTIVCGSNVDTDAYQRWVGATPGHGPVADAPRGRSDGTSPVIDAFFSIAASIPVVAAPEVTVRIVAVGLVGLPCHHCVRSPAASQPELELKAVMPGREIADRVAAGAAETSTPGWCRGRPGSPLPRRCRAARHRQPRSLAVDRAIGAQR